MSSWLTAQLKAAEGLLEAVDKTVSRTVGTLGLAEGEQEQFTGSHGEFSLPRSTSAVHQTNLPSGAALHHHHQSPSASFSYPTSVGAGSGYNVNLQSGSYFTSARPGAGSPWDGSRAAESPNSIRFDLGAGPISSLSRIHPAAAAGDASNGGPAGGFTVKANAPIPFGGTAPSPGLISSSSAAGSSTVMGPYNSSASLTDTVSKRVSATGAARPSGPDAAPATVAPQPQPISTPTCTPTTSLAVHGPPPQTASAKPGLGLGGGGAAQAAAPTATLQAATPRAAPPADHETPSTAAAGTSALAAAAADETPSLRDGGVGAGSGGWGEGVGGKELPGPSNTAAPAGALLTAPGIIVGLARAGTGPAAAGNPSAGESSPGDRPTFTTLPVPDPAQPGGGSTAAAADRRSVPSTPATVKGTAGEGVGSGASGNGNGAAAAAAAATTGQGSAQQPGTSTPTAGGATAGASATLASATAAASSLATTAVTHSLSFFNLNLRGADDDTDDSGDEGGGDECAASGGSSAAAAQQLQTLSRTCEQLRKRLEASRAENEQLEDMLARAEVKAQQEAALVAALREELAGLHQARAAAESSLSAQLAVARSSLAEVSDKYEASQRAVLVLEGQLAALEESSRRLMEQHNDREGGMLEALRAELASAESRLAAESRAHAASRAAAASRELDLEQQITGSTAALADLTRSLEEANRKSRALEEEVVETSRGRNDMAAQLVALQHRLAAAGIDLETLGDAAGTGAQPGAGGSAARSVAAAAAELEVLRGELAQHQRAAQLARHAAEASQAQVAAMAQELETLRQSVEQHKETAELEAQLREMTEMLYLKQTQMERLAAEKAAQQLKTERELESARQELAKLTRHAIQQGGGGGLASSVSTSSASHDVIPMDALGEPYQRLVRHNKVGRAVKAAANFLDSTASTTSFVLRQYPLARLAVFGYALLIHLYVYLLIARMQRLATHLEGVAAPVDG